MKKAEFIGYLMALDDMADSDEERRIIQCILKRAQQLEEPVQSIPYTPPSNPWDPYKPYITWSDTITWDSSNPINFELDITDSISYNCKIPEPNQWSVKKDPKLPSNWKIIK